jgi:hypothetical protein
MNLGKELTYTCHEFYTRQQTKLGPEEVRFSAGMDFYPQLTEYILRPGKYPIFSFTINSF